MSKVFVSESMPERTVIHVEQLEMWWSSACRPLQHLECTRLCLVFCWYCASRAEPRVRRGHTHTTLSIRDSQFGRLSDHSVWGLHWCAFTRACHYIITFKICRWSIKYIQTYMLSHIFHTRSCSLCNRDFSPASRHTHTFLMEIGAIVNCSRPAKLLLNCTYARLIYAGRSS